MFRTVPLSIIRRFSLYTQQWYISYRFADSLQAVTVTCMTYTIAVCTVKNFWWWAEELSETCRISFQNKFEKLVHLVCFILRICREVLSNFTLTGIERFALHSGPFISRERNPRTHWIESSLNRGSSFSIVTG